MIKHLLAFFLQIFLLILFLLSSCKEKPSYLIQANKEGISILDLEYINDSLEINLVDFRVNHLKEDLYELKIYLIAEEPDKYVNGDYKFFVHFYPEIKEEKSSDFLALGTKKAYREEDILVFVRQFQSQTHHFERVRYGLLDQTGKRLFTLTLNGIEIP